VAAVLQGAAEKLSNAPSKGKPRRAPHGDGVPTP